MRGDKTVARILLIFSITNFVLAAPAVVRRRRPLINDPVDEPTGGSEQDWLSVPQAGSPHEDWDLASPGGSTASSFHAVSPSRPPPLYEYLFGGSSLETHHQDWAQESGAPRLHDDASSGSEGWQIHDTPSQWWKQSTWRPTSPSQWEVGESSASGALRMQNNPQPASEAVQVHDDPLPASGAKPLHDDLHQWWQNLNPVTKIEEENPSSHWHSGTGAEALGASGSLGAEGASKVPWESWGSEEWEATAAEVAAATAKDAEEVEKLKPKGLCGLGFSCLHFHRSVKWSPERDHGHHFSWR